MRRMCVDTVHSLMDSFEAISLFTKPSATSRAICVSRGVSGSMLPELVVSWPHGAPEPQLKGEFR